MPLFYHVHRSTKPSKIEKKIILDKPLFLSRKKSFWYNVEKNVGATEYGGYIIYEICIPKNNFTYSFRPITNNKIVKITKDNVDKYIQLRNKYPGQINFFNELKKRNLIGYDATSSSIQEYIYNKMIIYKKTGMYLYHTPELAIIDFSNFNPVINIVEKFKSKK